MASYMSDDLLNDFLNGLFEAIDFVTSFMVDKEH
jgi:hypothetical protein